MSKKMKQSLPVIRQESIGKEIYSLWLSGKEMAQQARPGQFLSLYSGRGDRLLPRPVSICEIDRENGALRLVYRVTGPGTGTEEFSRLKPGDRLEALGPLGNGFPVEEAEGKKVLLIGGGIGIPPMLETAKAVRGEKQIVLGYRDEIFLKEEFEKYGAVYAAAEDGSAETKGNVLDAVREHALTGDLIFACGPAPMLRALKAYALEKGIRCYLSMEERMACGVGACLACVCKSAEMDSHSQVHNKRVCRDGPVFLSTEIVFAGEEIPKEIPGAENARKEEPSTVPRTK